MYTAISRGKWAALVSETKTKTRQGWTKDRHYDEGCAFSQSILLLIDMWTRDWTGLVDWPWGQRLRLRLRQDKDGLSHGGQTIIFRVFFYQGKLEKYIGGPETGLDYWTGHGDRD